jgi:hypothetical protein
VRPAERAGHQGLALELQEGGHDLGLEVAGVDQQFAQSAPRAPFGEVLLGPQGLVDGLHRRMAAFDDEAPETDGASLRGRVGQRFPQAPLLLLDDRGKLLGSQEAAFDQQGADGLGLGLSRLEVDAFLELFAGDEGELQGDLSDEKPVAPDHAD